MDRERALAQAFTDGREWTEDEAMADALAKHPECSYADWTNGLDMLFRMTIVVKLWRNEDCYLEGDPPRHTIQDYPRKGRKPGFAAALIGESA